jgi:twitching motility protein PilI
MARDRNRLVSFQEALGQRLRLAAAQPKRESRLAVRVADQNLLLDLGDIAEVSQIAQFTSVPFAKAWFLGIANVRGTLYAVSDLPAWMQGGRRSAMTAASRVVLLGQRLARLRTAIMVDRVIGLRLLDSMKAQTDVALAPWEKNRLTDADGIVWREADLGKLVEQQEFLQVV